MKKMFFLFTIFVSGFYSSVFAEKCYVYIEKQGNLNQQITATLAISLISQYIEPIESIPLTGISSEQCVYKIGVTESQSGLFATISGRNLSAYGDSKKGGTDGLQQALLRAIYRAKLDQKENICKAYGTVLVEDCGGLSAPTNAITPNKGSKKVNTVKSKEIFFDKENNLIWQRKAHNEKLNWYDAMDYCEELSLAELTEWRLPNKNELKEAIAYARKFNKRNRLQVYWSSTTHASDSSSAWYVYFGNGNVGGNGKSNSYYVRCVRSGE